MNDYFELNDKLIILYGAASIGSLAIKYFENNGYEVWGYIDKRGHEIQSFLGKKVYELDDNAIKNIDKEKCVIYVSVKNVFEHTHIANQLIKEGFHNIIYRPLPVINGKGDINQKSIYEVYNLIESGKIKECYRIPKTIDIKLNYCDNDYLIREKTDGSVVAMIAINSLYTDNKMSTTPWFDIPVMSLLPHIDLFNYIKGEPKVKYDRYLDFCIDSARNSDTIKVTDAWKKNVLKNRTDVYEHMNKSYELEPDFFYRNAPEVIWNEKRKIFNLNSGKHRAAFYASYRRKYIPVSLKKEDYDKYLNKSKADFLKGYLIGNNIIKLEAPIEHPLFFDYESEGTEFYYQFLYKIFYDITENIYEYNNNITFDKKTIFFELNDNGFLERAFNKAGFTIGVSNKYVNTHLLKMLDSLFYTNICDYMMEYSEVKANYSVIDCRKEIFCQCNNMLPKTSIMYYITFKDSDIESELINMQYSTVFFSSFINGQAVNVLKIKNLLDNKGAENG